MPDYELLSLFTEYMIASQTAFMNFVSIVFAFLIAGYFVAHRLNRVQPTCVNGFHPRNSRSSTVRQCRQAQEADIIREIFNADGRRLMPCTRACRKARPCATT
jgi:hypothetical protein